MKSQMIKKENIAFFKKMIFVYVLLVLLLDTTGQSNTTVEKKHFYYKNSSYNYDKNTNSLEGGYGVLEGELICHKAEDANDVVYRISVQSIKQEVSSSLLSKRKDIPVFEMKIVPDKKTGVIHIHFADKVSDTIVRDQQLRLGLDIFEKAMLDVISEKFVFSDTVKQNAVRKMQLETEVFQYYDVGEGKRDIRRDLTGGIKVTTYDVLPVITLDCLKEYILSNMQISPSHLDYQMYTKNRSDGCVTHAISLECNFVKKMTLDEMASRIRFVKKMIPDEIASKIRNLDDPNEFGNYYYIELIIRDN